MNEPTPARDASALMPGSRREFLARAALVAGVPVALGIIGYHRWRTPSRDGESASGPAPLPGLDAFAPLIGEKFTVAATEGQTAFSLVLAKAEPLKRYQAGVSEQFSLRFAPPAGQRVESRIHELFHPALGRLELFLCPVGSASRFGEDQKLEAILIFDRTAA